MAMKVKLNMKIAEKFNESKNFTPEKDYFVLSIECNEYLIVPDKTGPRLYPCELFVITDSTRPAEWITRFEESENDEQYEFSYPPEFSEPGFFDDYYNNRPKAVQIFNSYIEPLGIRMPRIVTPEGKVIQNPDIQIKKTKKVNRTGIVESEANHESQA